LLLRTLWTPRTRLLLVLGGIGGSHAYYNSYFGGFWLSHRIKCVVAHYNPSCIRGERGKLVNLSLESPFVSLNRVNLPSVFNPSARHTIVSRCRGRSSAHNRTVSEFFLLRLIPRDFFTASHVLLRYYGNASVIPIMPFNLF
jgi:hypothetical protein